MPQQRFALFSGGPTRLKVAWKPKRRSPQIFLDRRLVAHFEHCEQMARGWRYRLAEDMEVMLQWQGGADHFEAFLNQRRIRGAAMEVFPDVPDVAPILYKIAGINIVVGMLLVALLGILFADAVVIGVIFLILAILVSLGHRAALGTAIALTILGIAGKCVLLSLAFSVSGMLWTLWYCSQAGILFRAYLTSSPKW